MGARMRTLLVGDCASDRLYQMSDPDAPNESQFELFVAKALSCVYSDYFCIVFRGSFRYDDQLYRPDLALVARDFSHWFVVEVELTSHSFNGHVLPQVLAFRYGEPQSDCSVALSRELHVSQDRAQTLLRYVPRTIAVVANKRESRWQIALDAHNIQMLTVSVFRSNSGVEAVELDGMLEVMEENLGFGTYSATDRSIRFPKTVKLPIGLVQINDPAGSLSLWTVVRDRDCTWITKNLGIPNIPDGSYVQIVRSYSGFLSFRRPA
jgi:hypothetical protein